MTLSDPKTIRAITGWLEAYGLSSIEIERGGTRVAIRVQSVQTAHADASDVGAPIAGHVLAAHPSRISAEVVAAGEAGAYLRVGPMLVAALAPAPGRITARPADGTLLGFGDIAFTLEAQ
ncbi:hypothetical protein [Falsirhodobacter sp. 1013]|uniref:hypothetical protein n=1 Tax=Falsirhodobacter sp. 1013 TaxID=3417566 RepID=UPI003EBE9F08